MAVQTDYSLLNDPDMKEIFDSFLIETREILEKLDLNLVELENRPDDEELLNDIFRSFHTIKGTSGFLGLGKLQALTHHGEDILNKLRKGEAKVNEKIMDAILHGYDATVELLDVIEENKNEDYDTSEVTAELEAVIASIENGGGTTAKTEKEEKPDVEEKAEPEIQAEAETVATTEPVEPEEEVVQKSEAQQKPESDIDEGKSGMSEQSDYSLLNDPDMKEIFEGFLVETREILEKLDLNLVELENRPDDEELLNDIFRSFHTIKGTSGFLGLVKLQALTHHGEDILNKLRKGEAQVNEKIMDAILHGYDATTELLDVIEENKNEDYDTSEVTAELETVIASIENGGSNEPAKAEKVKPEKQADDGTVAHKTGKTDEKEINKNEPPQKKQSKISEDKPKNAKMSARDRLNKMEKKSSTKKGENTIRVDVERLDDLLNYVQELVLGRNQLAQLNSEMQIKHEGTPLAQNLMETTQFIDLMTTELQLAVMKTRMIKIGKVFNRFPRLVRDLSKETGKEIKLEIKGEDTELDKTLIEEINDPLVHLIRNSVDHGVEPPEEREKVGKPRKGKVLLAAEHEGNNIIITVEDDGKGIDPEVIKSIAIKKGIISKDRANELTKKEIYNLIFAPGFSTAKKVTNVSGRGVGMDVVKTNVTKLRGVIEIDSEVGKGSKIIIKLPLTLAIIHGLLVDISGETIVIPLSTVIEVVRISKKDIYYVNQVECIKLRDTVHPLLAIDALLYENGNKKEERDWQYIVIVGIAEKRFGLKVDHLIGQKEVVIKSLGNYLGDIEGIAGSTIMGDGKVVMIADIAEIVTKVRSVN